MLPAAIGAAGNMVVLIDGGIRRGTDIVKALGLGARAVLVGRPFLYAAVVGGEAGVDHAIRLLGRELDRDMAMLGVRSLAGIDRDCLMSCRHD